MIAIIALSIPGRAEPPPVILGHPSSPGPVSTEVLNRIWGELTADGYKVSLVDSVPPMLRTAMLLDRSHATGAVILGGVFIEDAADAVDLRIVDGLTGRTFERRVEADKGTEQSAGVLAIRTVDILRASFLEFVVDSLHSAIAQKPPAPPPSSPARATDSSRLRWALEGGIGLLDSFDGVGPAVLPLARASYALNEMFRIRLSGAWLGSEPRVETVDGTATIAQGIGLAECMAVFAKGSWVHPHLSLGAGSYYVAVDGNGAPPHEGRRSTTLAFALSGGAGLSASLDQHLELRMEVQTLVTAPGVSIRFLDTDIGRIGRPSVLTALSLAGQL